MLFILMLFVGCGNTSTSGGNEYPTSNPPLTPENSQEVIAPNLRLPQVMIDDTLYYMSGKEKPVIKIAEGDYLGIITSVVPTTQIPTMNEQANIDVEGAPYAKFENGIVVLWNDEWTLFLTENELLFEEG